MLGCFLEFSQENVRISQVAVGSPFCSFVAEFSGDFQPLKRRKNVSELDQHEYEVVRNGLGLGYGALFHQWTTQIACSFLFKFIKYPLPLDDTE